MYEYVKSIDFALV